MLFTCLFLLLPLNAALGGDEALLGLQYQRRLDSLLAEDWDGRITLADWCQSQRLYRQAEMLYRQVLRHRPGLRRAYQQLTQLSERVGLPELTAYEQAVLRDASPNLQMFASDHFVVVYDTDRWWAQEQAALLEKSYECFYRVFRKAGFQPLPLRQRLICVMFDDVRTFDSYVRRAEGTDMSWSGGFFSARSNRVALFLEDQKDSSYRTVAEYQPPAPTPQGAAGAGSDTQLPAMPSLATVPPPGRVINVSKTAHEAAHQLAFNSGLQSRGVMYPLWISEGMAVNFENALRVEPFSASHDNVIRRQHLLAALESGQLMPLAEFIAVSQVPTAQPRRINSLYAQSWALFQFLFTRYPQQLARYMQNLAQLPPGSRSKETLGREFTNAFGSLASLEAKWKVYLRTLESRP